MDTYRHLRAVALMCGMGLFSAACVAAGTNGTGDITKNPPPGENFKPVSELTALPDYLPGMGRLYVDPATLPAGPFLGYDRNGELVNVIYMVPLAAMENKQPFDGLGAGLPGIEVDHTDLAYNPGHPGVEEPHYHIVQWLISHDEEQQRMK